MTEKTWPEIDGFKGILHHARAENYPLSEYTLRRAVHAGAIPCRVVGRTYLIAWSNVVRWMTCADGADNAPLPSTEASGIRRLEVSG